MIPALIEAALRAIVVALTVWAGLRLFRVSNVPAQKAAWGLVLSAAVAMPLLMRWQFLPASVSVRLPVPAWQPARQPLPAARPATSDASAGGQMTLPRQRVDGSREPRAAAADRFPAPTISNSKFDASLNDRPVQVQPAPPQTKPQAYGLRIAARAAGLRLLEPGSLAALIYLAVVAGLLLRMMLGVHAAARLWLSAEPLAAEIGPDRGTVSALGLRLRSSPAVCSPVTIGSGVVLPADYAEWDAEKLRIVLAHERAHVRQGDFYLQLLASLYAAVFWFSPLGWWLKRKLSDLGEAISDRAGLEEAASRTAYAQVLLEFAALPRPTAIGVAMARRSNLSHRIERLLNESSFRQAFAGTRRRILLAILLVPVALFAGTALIRVEASASGQAVPPAPAAAPSSPSPAADQVPPAPGGPVAALSPDAVPAPAAAPAPPSGPLSTVIPDGGRLYTVIPDGGRLFMVIPDGGPAVPPVPPVPPQYGEIREDDNRAVTLTDTQVDTVTKAQTDGNGKRGSTSVGRGYSYSYSSDGNSWALVTDPSDRVTFSGDWHDSTRANIDKARKMTNGKFLWFTRDGKSYVVDDPALIAQIQAMYKPMEDLGRQQEILGKQQEVLGRQQEELGKKQEQATVPTPDISKEMAELNAAVAKLDAKKGSTVNQDELAEIEGKLGEIQGRLGAIQGEMGSKQGEFGAMQGKLGAEQGKLGAEQGRLGAEQGKIAAEADRKVKSIIDESLHNGKARPVE